MTLDRVRLRDYDTLLEYDQAVYEYVKERYSRSEKFPEHYETRYPLTGRCPKCDGVVRIQYLSPADDPIYTCMDSYVGTHDYLTFTWEDGFTVED